MDMNHSIPGVRWHILDAIRGTRADAGIVDQNIETPEFANDLLRQIDDHSLIGRIADKRSRVDAQFLQTQNRLVGRVTIYIVNSYGDTFCS